jgi:hypothetical protein
LSGVDRLRLFHFSEVGTIKTFVPKPVDVPSTRPSGQEWLNGPLNWAVDETRQASYLFPRDCPRILVWPTSTTNDAVREEWFDGRDFAMVAYVESSWFERIQRQVLFRYEMPTESFRATEDEWMWVSRNTVVPSDVRRIDDLTSALEEECVDVRVVRSLASLRGLWESTLHVSGIRLRNASDWMEA